MSLPLRALARLVVCSGFAFIASPVLLGDSYSPLGGEYPVVGSLPGDQVFPRVAFNPNGGYIVWQDNVTDGDGDGISARRLDGSLSGTLSTFRVNQTAAGDQQNPRVAMLKNGGAAFTWQGPSGAHSRIYARFMAGDGTFATGDVMVNSYTQNLQIDPSVACLSDGSVVITWSSYLQDGNLHGVYAQRLSATGQKLGSEFQVNQSTLNNQRTPVVTALADGGFVIVWISERLRGVANAENPDGGVSQESGLPVYDVDVFSRRYDAAGVALQNESKVNNSPTICANPDVSGLPGGGFLIVWGGKPGSIATGVSGIDTNGWEIYGRAFDGTGAATGNNFRVNPYTYGDQYLPKVAAAAGGYLVVWTTLNQDGSREGVAGLAVSPLGVLLAPEFHVNTTTISQQIYPCIGSDGDQQFLVAWSSFVGGSASFDLFSQRFSATQTLVPPAPPFVAALSQAKLSVTWPDMAGYPVDAYEVYVDGSNTPNLVHGNLWTVSGLAPGTTHSFKLGYVLTDGSRSPLSQAVTGITWGEDNNFDGLPDDWQIQYWGSDSQNWPGANADNDSDGAGNLQEFLAGTDPANSSSVLRVSVVTTAGGYRFSWNTQPGQIYQVQSCEDFGQWINVGSGRFAHGTVDSISMGGGGSIQLYRVIRLR